ncbi:hypothetical protein V6N12_052655 [Hibiscus sabdariffa]|uniref:WRKY domain-containing protein n=1 Tax=Hibiscus sabdariffa TaxID=183260 RepID=A0ABR2C259_9ROSI
MLLDLFSYPKTDDQMAIQEVASQGLKSMDHLIRLLPHQSNHVECTDVAVPKSKKAISLINRTGHARFRRGPLRSSPSLSSPSSSSFRYRVSSNSSFMSSAITGDGSDSNGKKASYLSLKPAPATASAEKPLLSSALVQFDDINENLSGSGNGKFGYPKRRKHRKTKVISVPAISSKISDIPSDDYTWRKYGQKRIKGSPYPRGYYKCSAVRGCPARKHVERDPDDPSMLIVTYDWEHRH